MKTFMLVLFLAAGAQASAAMHPASQVVRDTLTQGEQILALQDEDQRLAQMCTLIGERFHTEHIAGVWLGDFSKINRDQAAISRFPKLIPDILISKVFGSMSGEPGEVSGTFAVDENPVDRGNGLFEVGVTITSEGGNSYRGSAILKAVQAGYKAVDIEFMNMSAVEYQGQEFQDILAEEFNKDVKASLPVSALIERLESESNFPHCP